MLNSVENYTINRSTFDPQVDKNKFHKTAEKFTAVFFTQFVNEMFKTCDERLGGFGEEVYESFLSEKIADHLVTTFTGQEMTALIESQMISLQEK